MTKRIASQPGLSLATLLMALGVAFEFLRAFTDVGGRGLDGFTEAWVYSAVEWIAVGICAARAVRRRRERLAWVLMAVGLAAWSVGDLIWTLWLDDLANPPFPSVADLAYLLMYPAIAASLLLLIGGRLRPAGAAQWLDGGAVGLTVAAIAAAIVFPGVLAHMHGRTAADVVNLAYPVGDCVLLVFVGCAFSVAAWRPGLFWLMIGAGVTASAIADSGYATQAADASYVAGALVNAMFVLSIALLALAAWVPDRPHRRVAGHSARSIVVTMVMAGIAVALLVAASFVRVTPLAVCLAAGALLLACVRTAMTYFENIRMLGRAAQDAAIVSSSHDAIIAARIDGVVTAWNPAAERLYGYSAREAIGRPASMIDADGVQVGEILARVRAGELIEDLEIPRRRKDGSIVEVAVSVSPVRDAEGRVIGMSASGRDITARRRAEAALVEAQDRFRSAFEDSPVGMVMLDLEFRYIQVNTAFCRMVGYTREYLLRTGFEAITHPDDVQRDRAGLLSVLAGEQTSYVAEKRYVHASGYQADVAVHATLLRAPNGTPLSFLSHAQDITDRKRHERQLEFLADHDVLTGLLNRRAFNRELASHAGRADRYGAVGAVLVIDLDNFKFVNDTLGHHTGDKLIVRAAHALAARLRSSDVLARLGGDEFGVLLPEADNSEALQVAESLVTAVRGSAIAPKPLERTITASIGIATFQDRDALSGEDVLVNADLAMYDAKQEGRDRAAAYANADHREARTKGRIAWAHRIHEALAEDRFTLLAQPIVHLATGIVDRYELLLRMLGEHGELIAPAAFLEVAERVDLIQRVDMWVISRAMRTLSESDLHAGTVFEINLSGASIGDPIVLAHIENELQRFDVDPSRVIFEITETAALGSVSNAQAFGERLSRIGCRFALDDFGVGFGSLYYLKHLPLDIIKIDGGFVRNCRSNPTDRILITAIVDIARGLGKQTIAEFVPDDATVSLLNDLGVDYGQGYHLGRPAPIGIQIAGDDDHAIPSSIAPA